MKPKGFRGTPQTIGDHIKARRLALELRQKEAAAQLGTDQWTLINWEKNRTQPAVSSYPAVVAFLGYVPAPAPETIAQRIRARRRGLGLSINQVAEAHDVDPTAWGNWENGGTILRRDHRRLVAAFISMDESALDQEMRRAWIEAHGTGGAEEG